MTSTSKALAGPTNGELMARAESLGLHGLLAEWERFSLEPWLTEFLDIEEAERAQRSLERRLKSARLGRFKSMADFDWSWPDKLDRELIEELLKIRFPLEGANLFLFGPNGVGKTMLAKNIAYQGVLEGFTVRFTTASELLSDLVSQESASALQRCLRKYIRPRILVIDELGYLSYDNRHADLLFELVSRRYAAGDRSLIITSNRPFKEWDQTFPNASCVVTLVDRLVHRSEIVEMKGKSYRLREARERTEKRAKERASRRRSREASKKPQQKGAKKST